MAWPTPAVSEVQPGVSGPDGLPGVKALFGQNASADSSGSGGTTAAPPKVTAQLVPKG